MVDYLSIALDKNEFIKYLKEWSGRREYLMKYDMLYVGVCHVNKSKVGITHEKRLKKREKEWKRKINDFQFVKSWITTKINAFHIEQFTHTLLKNIDLHFKEGESKEIFNVLPSDCINLMEVIYFLLENENFDRVRFVNKLIDLKKSNFAVDIKFSYESNSFIRKIHHIGLHKLNTDIDKIISDMSKIKIEDKTKIDDKAVVLIADATPKVNSSYCDCNCFKINLN